MPVAARRLLRPSLRVFLVAVLIFGAGLGWIIERAKAQREAVDAIRRLGGVVRYDLETDQGSYFDRRPGRPPLLDRFLGPEYFDDVTFVGFPSSLDAEAAMPSVGHLRRLREIRLGGTNVTDAGLAQLRGMDHLREIALAGTRVTGEGLAALADLPRLEVIASLPDGPLGEAGYRNLGRLGQLAEFHLNCHDTDVAHLHHLRDLTRLQKLGLSLGEMTVGRIDVDPFLKFAELEELSLSFIPIEDAGLARLASLPRLRKLHLTFARVTPAGVEAFRTRRPDVTCSVVP